MKLYSDSFYISPFVFSVFVALKEKGLNFEIEEVGLDRKEQLEPKYRDKSLTNKVPMIEHEGMYLTESSAIVEYIEENFPAPRYPALFPEDKTDRARARMVMSWLRSDLMPLRTDRPTTTIFYYPEKNPMTTDGKAAAEKLIYVAENLLKKTRTPFLFGEWCIADADLGFMLQRLVANSETLPSRLKEYAETQWKRPSAQAFIQIKRAPYVSYY